MEDRINEGLKRTVFSSQDELKRYTTSMQSMIQEYEQNLYETDGYNKVEREKIKQWRDELYVIVQRNRDIPESNDSLDELERTVRVVHRQVSKADTNQKLLDKGTLKLMGLNYTNMDIEKALEDGRRKLRESKKKERSEVLLIIGAFIAFVSVCFLIIFDKFVSRK